MADDRLLYEPLMSLAAKFRSQETTPTELLEVLLARIEKTDGSVQAYVTVTPDLARKAARRAETELKAGKDRGPLHGIPVSVKDLIDTKGVRTTYGSPIFANHVPKADAAVVAKLKRAGAVIAGKTNTHEFALGGITPPTRNPWDLARVPGGSSGGSAAAVAAGSAVATLGSDTGGSIRIPASYCGVAGHKPTFGLVSRVGVFPESWSLDHVGPIARYVTDCAALLDAIAGYDPRDPAMARRKARSFRAAIQGPWERLRLGVPSNLFFEHVDRQVVAAVRDAIRKLESFGLEVQELTFPAVDEIFGAYNAIDLAEIGANHRRIYPDHANEYLPESKVLIESALLVDAARYIDALRARPILVDRVLEAMAGVDLLAVPSQPIVAPKVGEIRAVIDGYEEDLLLTMVRLDAPFNLLGFPTLSVSCGFNAEGLPIGLQIVGKPDADGTVLRVGHAYQEATDWHTRIPRLEG